MTITENDNETSLVGTGTAPTLSPSPQTSQHEGVDEANDKPASSSSIRRTTPLKLNHFENYLQLKSNKTETTQMSNAVNNQYETNAFSADGGKKLEGRDEKSNQYNHFTAPFQNNASAFGTRRDAKIKSSYSSSQFTNAERSQTLDRFANIFMERMGEAMSSGKLSQAWGIRRGEDCYSSITENYALERDMIKPHITPIVWGSSCVLLTLFSMRFGRWYQNQQVRSLWGRTAVAETKLSSTAMMRQRQRNPSQLEDVRLNGIHSSRPHKLHNSSGNSSSSSSSSSGVDMTVPVDISLSLLFGISTTIFLTDKHRLLYDFARAPLLVGKSVLAEELCTPFQKEVMDKNNEFWQDDENLGEFDSLRAVRDFVIHCHLRDKSRVSSAEMNDVGREEE